MIPKGNYKAKALSGAWGESAKKGTPFVRVPFQIVGGEQEGNAVSWDGYFTEATTPRTMDSLRYCGCTFPNDDVTNLTGIGDNIVDIVVEHESWLDEKSGEQKQRARVAWVNGAGGIPEDQQMDDRKKASFAARMKGMVVNTRKKAGASPNGAGKPAPREEEPYGDDSELLF